MRKEHRYTEMPPEEHPGNEQEFTGTVHGTDEESMIDSYRYDTDGESGDGYMEAARDMSTTDEALGPLFDQREMERMRGRWIDIQAGFVDEPREAVQQADDLVGDMINRLSDIFTDERKRLERQWAAGDDVTTEELRVAIRRYRAFFDRLLSM